jgi:hypothetical protein
MSSWGNFRMVIGLALLSAPVFSCAEGDREPESASKVAAPPGETVADQGPAATGARGDEGATPGQSAAACPMAISGAEVEVGDTDGGVALTFTAGAGDVDELQRRVETMARHYEMRPRHRHMMWWRMGPDRGMGAGRGAGPGPMPIVKAIVEKTERGARLLLTPTDPSQLEALREHTRRQQQRMQAGECWMWGRRPPTDEEASP